MVKNFFRKKINLRILSIFFLLLVSGNALLYINNSFHYYSVSYKVTVPTFKEIRNNQIIYLPLIDYYQFSKTLQNSNEINKNCSDFEKNFKINIWEAGDIENYSIKIRSKVEKKIDICFNEVLNEIEKFKQAEIKNARETMSFSTKTYFNSLKKVVTDDDYLAFIEFLKNSDITFNNFNDLTVLNSPNHSNLDDEFIETLLTIMQMEEKKKLAEIPIIVLSDHIYIIL